MHAGHTGTEAGAFVPRRAVKRFIEQQTAIFAGLNQGQAAMADFYFSLWSNTYHEQVSPNLIPHRHCRSILNLRSPLNFSR